jgi:hypothetical protein
VVPLVILHDDTIAMREPIDLELHSLSGVDPEAQGVLKTAHIDAHGDVSDSVACVGPVPDIDHGSSR